MVIAEELIKIVIGKIVRNAESEGVGIMRKKDNGLKELMLLSIIVIPSIFLWG